mgnify:CR=1 FL=1
MKKRIRVLIAIFFVLTILLSSTGFVIAAPLKGGPSISPSSGGGTATLTTIPVSKLPGTEANAAGTLFPQGHTSGDLMFSGSGVQVSGLVGSATLSMPLANYAQGWNGSIYQWLNDTWTKIPTTVNQNEESLDGTAAATIYSDGIYALIVTYKLPDEEMGRCKSYDFKVLPGGYVPGGIFYTGAVIIGNFNTTNLIERSFNYRVISLDPSITFRGDVAGTVYVHDFEEIEGGKVVIWLEFTEVEALVGHNGGEDAMPPFIFRVYIDGCKVDYVVTEGGEGEGD